MAIPADLTAALNAIDTDTDALAAVVTSLRDKISTGMSAADVTAVKDKLTAVASRLEGIAADPNVPVPPGPTPTPIP